MKINSIKTITDVFRHSWDGNLMNKEGRCYYLQTSLFAVGVTHVKDSTDIILKRYLYGKENPWWINRASLCGILAGFSGIITIRLRPNTNETYSFSFKLISGQINFLRGTLRLSAIKDFESFAKELSKLDHLFLV